MAVFTGDSLFQRVQVQFPVVHRPAGVAPKTVADLHVAKFSSESFVEILRVQPFISRSNFQTLNGRIITDKTLVVIAVSFKHPGLRILSECPADRKRDGSCPISYGICALRPLGLNEVLESPFLKRKLRMRK